jgi:cytochrome c peroxidase
LKLPPNPFLGPNGTLGELAQRGKRVFESKQAACADCHMAPTYSDGSTHDVGLGSDSDKYKGHNTPSLLGVYRRVRYLHDGRAKTLEAVLKEFHGPDVVSNGDKLSDQQIEELVAYLKTL